MSAPPSFFDQVQPEQKSFFDDVQPPLASRIEQGVGQGAREVFRNLTRQGGLISKALPVFPKPQQEFGETEQAPEPAGFLPQAAKAVTQAAGQLPEVAAGFALGGPAGGALAAGLQGYAGIPEDHPLNEKLSAALTNGTFMYAAGEFAPLIRRLPEISAARGWPG